MFGVVWDYYSSKLKGKQYKQNTVPKNYRTEIKMLSNPGLAQSGFEQHGPDECMDKIYDCVKMLVIK